MKNLENNVPVEETEKAVQAAALAEGEISDEDATAAAGGKNFRPDEILRETAEANAANKKVVDKQVQAVREGLKLS